MHLLHSAIIFALASLAAADRITYSYCNSCSPLTSPSGAPNCNSNVYQYNGEGDGNCDAFATGDIADGGCTRSDKVDTPRGESTYEVPDGCEGKGVGATLGSVIVKAGPVGNGYNCLKTEGTFTNECGITYACARLMECFGTG